MVAGGGAETPGGGAAEDGGAGGGAVGPERGAEGADGEEVAGDGSQGSLALQTSSGFQCCSSLRGRSLADRAYGLASLVPAEKTHELCNFPVMSN